MGSAESDSQTFEQVIHGGVLSSIRNYVFAISGLNGVHQETSLVEFTEASSPGAYGSNEHGLKFSPAEGITRKLREVHGDGRCSG